MTVWVNLPPSKMSVRQRIGRRERGGADPQASHSWGCPFHRESTLGPHAGFTGSTAPQASRDRLHPGRAHLLTAQTVEHMESKQSVNSKDWRAA